VVKGQGRDFIGDWPADNFVRWAHCLGFISYDYASDAFSITPLGLRLTGAYTGSGELNDDECTILTDAVLAYPPAIRVLSLLSEGNAHLTKFEIGSQLGFVGDGGFTSMPQNVLIRALAQISDAKERNGMRNDWEGSSDKYARQICSWLGKLGFVDRVAKNVTVSIGTKDYTETIGQAYMITAQGITALNRARGKSRHARIPKNVSFEMLATKGSDREFLRMRRAFIIKKLCEGKRSTNVDDIVAYLAGQDIAATSGAVFDDVHGLQNIGLDIGVDSSTIVWRDRINEFAIPVCEKLSESTIEQVKDTLRGNLYHIPHGYLALLDLAYDNKQNRLFEMKTLQLLTEECGYAGMHLGGGRKPDGVIYTTAPTDNYGVIIDTKAYSNGYNLPIGQADEMLRYVQENQRRDAQENPNKWWENFGADVLRFCFLFVSGKFIGNYQEQIDRIAHITKVRGAAVGIGKLLLLADDLKGGECTFGEVESKLFGASSA
jgi:hypothetical protein